jgi:hypothetical protein
MKNKLSIFAVFTISAMTMPAIRPVCAMEKSEAIHDGDCARVYGKKKLLIIQKYANEAYLKIEKIKNNNNSVSHGVSENSEQDFSTRAVPLKELLEDVKNTMATMSKLDNELSQWIGYNKVYQGVEGASEEALDIFYKKCREEYGLDVREMHEKINNERSRLITLQGDLKDALNKREF